MFHHELNIKTWKPKQLLSESENFLRNRLVQKHNIKGEDVIFQPSLYSSIERKYFDIGPAAPLKCIAF